MLRICCMITLAVATALPRAAAQEVTGVITGQVKDRSGAVVAGAEVTALHTPTGSARKALADEGGSYVFTSLPIGLYELSVAHPGFKKTVRRGIELHVSDHLGIDLTLELGALAEEISVV